LPPQYVADLHHRHAEILASEPDADEVAHAALRAAPGRIRAPVAAV
jgi:hypothetical protein